MTVNASPKFCDCEVKNKSGFVMDEALKIALIVETILKILLYDYYYYC